MFFETADNARSYPTTSSRLTAQPRDDHSFILWSVSNPMRCRCFSVGAHGSRRGPSCSRRYISSSFSWWARVALVSNICGSTHFCCRYFSPLKSSQLDISVVNSSNIQPQTQYNSSISVLRNVYEAFDIRSQPDMTHLQQDEQSEGFVGPNCNSVLST